MEKTAVTRMNKLNGVFWTVPCLQLMKWWLTPSYSSYVPLSFPIHSKTLETFTCSRFTMICASFGPLESTIDMANGSAESAYTLQWVPLSTRIAPLHVGSEPPMWHMMLSAHMSPQPKWQLDRFSCLCTDDCGVSLYFTMICLFFPQNCPFPCWHLDLM